MEKKGIVSDRCELNRQIKADNALLRETKARMKKLVQAVKITLSALAEAMETLRANMIVFRYQLRYISRGKYKLGQYLDAAKPTLAEYLAVVQKIKNAVKERKSLLAEKKEISFWNLSKTKELNAKITELTEDIEELKSEKSVLLYHLNCRDDTGITVIKKDIAAVEAGLSKLERQEAKRYSELEAALSEYAAQRIQSAYGEKYDPLVMFDSKRDVDELFHEDAEERGYRREQQNKQIRRDWTIPFNDVRWFISSYKNLARRGEAVRDIGLKKSRKNINVPGCA